MVCFLITTRLLLTLLLPSPCLTSVGTVIDWASDRADKTLLTRCYGEQGCFSIGGKFVSVQRPLNLFPATPKEIDLRLLLYTRSNPKFAEIINGSHEAMADSSFLLGVPVKFIIHGFLEDGTRKWVKSTAYELLRRGNFNVISVDWKQGAQPPYTQAVANTRMVGALIAQFIAFLQENGYSPPAEFMHIIGHSLGAHVAGYVGERLNRLGRISGLDPALPYFENTHPVVRLDPSDAILVDVIHTDVGSILHSGFGMGSACGHVDFYPNGGKRQPGCADNIIQSISRQNGNVYGGMQNFVGCNHLRAHDYFIESVNPPCPFLAVQCSSYEQFSVGECFDCGTNGDRCAPMGYHSVMWYNTSLPYSHPVKMYLHTGSEAPFCRYHHRVKVKMTTDLSKSEQKGKLIAVLTNIYGFTSRLSLNKEEIKFFPATTYVFLVALTDSAALRQLSLTWQPSSNVLNQLTWRMLRGGPPEIHVDSVEIHCLESNVKSTFCIKDFVDAETTVTVSASRFCASDKTDVEGKDTRRSAAPSKLLTFVQRVFDFMS